LSKKHIWDLFAGSGSMGLEFLSQGSSDVVWVEKVRSVISFVELNIAECNLKDFDFFINQKTNVICSSVEGFLKAPKKYQIEVSPDLVFLGPPENQNWMKKISPLLRSCPLVTSSTRILAEHLADEPFEDQDIEILNQKVSGKKQATLFQFKI